MGKKQKTPRGEMPFLEHLDELRERILWSLGAVLGGALIGYGLVNAIDIIGFLRAPIAPYLPDGRLAFTSPAEPFLITLKVAVSLGLVLASPIIIWQVWKFLAPALYDREKKVIIPTLGIGLVLFLAGAAAAYDLILPTAIRLLFGVNPEDFTPVITAPAYFTFAVRLVLAFGAITEIPLVLTILGAFGVVSSHTLRKYRRYALVIAAVLAAFLTPPDVVSMFLMMGPVMVLYEVSIWAVWLIERRRKRTIGAGLLLMVLVGAGTPLSAQDPVPDTTRIQDSIPAPQDTTRRDSVALAARDSVRAGQAIDTATARRLGLPTAPALTFPQSDSIIEMLLNRAGYRPIRYRARSVTFLPQTREIVLDDSVLVERSGGVLEADSMRYFEDQCLLRARGSPKLFQDESVLIGSTMRFDTCLERGIVTEALTDFQQGGATWYMRGQLAVDESATRIYAGDGKVTTCDLPTPHYRFEAGRVKWLTENIFVARPAVLYVRDVPVMWLPFIFQDIRRGRRSGFLTPRVGLNDIVRPSRSVRRQIQNIGYYWAMTDYTDLTVAFDWFAGLYTNVSAQFNYRWLNRFMSGAVRVGRQAQLDGGSALNLQWNHNQQFSSRANLAASINFSSNTTVVERNAIDPTSLTATLDSRLRFTRAFDWGQVDIGGSRSQTLTESTVRQTLPSLSITPSSVAIGRSITWSPRLSFTNDQTLNQPGGTLVVPGDTLELQSDTRRTRFDFGTPFRIGSWNWNNSIQITDDLTTRRQTQTITDPTTGEQRQIVTGETFTTGIDWNTSINLPALFRNSWRLQPSVNIQNVTGGPFFIRNQNTGGKFVSQSKRLGFGATISPTLFGFFPGVGPLSRIRHSLSPSVAWNYAPSAKVPEEYARALDPNGSSIPRASRPRHDISLRLSQTFEGKERLAEGDTTSDPRNARKVKLLQLNTSEVRYDFEQAKEPGKRGFSTQTVTNTVTSQLLQGLSLSTTHDLWAGPVADDTSAFSPFLTRVSVRASISGRTIGALFGLLGIGGERAEPTDLTEEEPMADTTSSFGFQPIGRPIGVQNVVDRLEPPRGGRRGFQLSANFDLDRRRPIGGQEIGPVRKNLGLQFSFSPTEKWSVAWNTSYNITAGEFEQHVVRLDRELHRWRATFSFVQLANGNFVFNFGVNLTDQPDIQFQYDQQTVER